jgi:hypothetical protein
VATFNSTSFLERARNGPRRRAYGIHPCASEQCRRVVRRECFRLGDLESKFRAGRTIQCVGMPNDELMEALAIRTVVDNWVLWRDAGDWDRFRGVWHDDGYMMATWFQGTAEEFIRVSQEGFQRGVNILHFQGAFSADIDGMRAISQTKMTINQRALVHDVLCDVVCTGRFYDFFEKRNNRWRIVLRQPIYEKDRMDPVDPGKLLSLDPKLLQSFPEGYRHLAYLQSNIGYKVKTDMPGLKGAAVEALYTRGKRWLAGGPIER